MFCRDGFPRIAAGWRNDSLPLSAEPVGQLGITGGPIFKEVHTMASFVQRYLEYRRVGLGRIAAFRFAWVISAARVRRIAIR
jgi:hypothetical protein